MDLVIGVDFGSDSARAVVIDAKDGHKEGEGICEYPRWMEGRYCDSSRGMFRQHPKDYIEALEQSVREALEDAGPDAGKKIRALSVDTTHVRLTGTGYLWHYFRNFQIIPMRCFIFGRTTLQLQKQQKSMKRLVTLKGRIILGFREHTLQSGIGQKSCME